MKLNPVPRANLRTKLVLLYMLTIALPLVAVGYIVISVYGSKVVEQTTSITRENTIQTARNLQVMLAQYVEIVNRLSYDQQLNDYLTPSRVYRSDLESIDAYSLYLKPATFYDYNYKELDAQIKIFFQNETLLQDGIMFLHADFEVQNLAEYRSARAAEGRLVWGTALGRIYIARAMYNVQGQLVAVVSLQIPESRLRSLIDESEGSGKTVLIADSRGSVITSSDRGLVGDSLLGRAYFRPVQQKSAPFDYVDPETGKSFKVIEESLSDGQQFLDWRLLTLVPLDRIINEEKTIRRVFLLVSLGALLLSCVIFLSVLNRITTRIKLLVRKMQTVKQGELTMMKETGVSDEIGALARSFNDMIEHLQRSIYENYEVNLQLKDITIRKQEAELYALQNQINPHFLFNTLESIRMGLHNKGDAEMSGLVLKLSKLFRNTLYWQGELIRLHEELEMIESYLTIQKYRFEDRIQYSLDLPELLRDAYVPKLTIQPIVENAVKHGLEGISGKGLITIAVREERPGVMEIAIQDNGSGIAPERLALLTEELASHDLKKSKSIGMKNVQDRLQLHYGPEYGITVSSEGEGVRVTVTLPIRYELGH
ncbi:cache domain-containing sensor histidine kinase [Paenibacillus koleovorans]|uniref:cache domain-containing sensor histidine kinase n=1 Tax=Paenibacillus koleovorans TaxID=121608 RepID=UPI000FD86C92|nr:sensor histidine kinase [Paenibacillus koleovorans]